MKYIIISAVLIVSSLSEAKISKACDVCLIKYRKCLIYAVTHDHDKLSERYNLCKLKVKNCSNRNHCEKKNK